MLGSHVLSRQIATLGRGLANAPFALALKSLRRLSRAETLRRKFFKFLPPGMLVLAGGESEVFVVNSSDRVIGKHLYARGRYDLDKALRVLELAGATPDCCFVDVGANIGPICIPLVKRGLVARAIAIEPGPDNFRLLSANVLLNDIADQVTLVNAALGPDPDGWLEFELSADNFGDHRVRTGVAAGRYDEDKRRTIRVPSTTLDRVLEAIDPAKVIVWMDVQGFEGFVLEGAARTLQARVPIALEFWPYGLQRADAFGRMKTALLDAGYSRLIELPSGAEQELTADNIDALYARLGTDGRCSDILVLPNRAADAASPKEEPPPTRH